MPSVEVQGCAGPHVQEMDLDNVITQTDMTISSQVLQKECNREFAQQEEEAQIRTMGLLHMAEVAEAARVAKQQKRAENARMGKEKSDF